MRKLKITIPDLSIEYLHGDFLEIWHAWLSIHLSQCFMFHILTKRKLFTPRHVLKLGIHYSFKVSTNILKATCNLHPVSFSKYTKCGNKYLNKFIFLNII